TFKGEDMTETLVMNRHQRLLYFPSLHSNENKFSVAFKFVFEVFAKLFINWWALGLLYLAEKTRQKWFAVVIKQIPNSLSFFRIVAIPIICFHLAVAVHGNIYADAVHWFAIMVVVICLDAIDGPAARDLDAVSEFGA